MKVQLRHYQTSSSKAILKTVPAVTHSRSRFLYYPCLRYIPLLYRSSNRPFYNKRLNQNSLRISFFSHYVQFVHFILVGYKYFLEHLQLFSFKVKYVSYPHKTVSKLLLNVTLLFWKVHVILVIFELINVSIKNIISTSARKT